MSDVTDTGGAVDQACADADAPKKRKTMKAFLIERLQAGGNHTVKDLTAAVMEAGLSRSDDEKKVRASVSVTLTLLQTKDKLQIVKPSRGVYAWAATVPAE